MFVCISQLISSLEFLKKKYMRFSSTAGILYVLSYNTAWFIHPNYMGVPVKSAPIPGHNWKNYSS
jgi:hypothetical protein